MTDSHVSASPGKRITASIGAWQKPLGERMSSLTSKLGWIVFATVGAFAFAVIALQRGEPIGAIWIVIATVCVYTIAYRFYSQFIASRVLRLDPTRMTPAYKFND